MSCISFILYNQSCLQGQELHFLCKEKHKQSYPSSSARTSSANIKKIKSYEKLNICYIMLSNKLPVCSRNGWVILHKLDIVFSSALDQGIL